MYVIFQIWNLAAALTGALLVDRLGRRALFMTSNAGMLMGQCLRRMRYDGSNAAANSSFSLSPGCFFVP